MTADVGNGGAYQASGDVTGKLPHVVIGWFGCR
jgi:hypothetical protein